MCSEFLEYEPDSDEPSKQDCEQQAFHRLAARIKKAFPRLSIMLLLDGLYPNGPIMARCRTYHWDFMIVLNTLARFSKELAGLFAELGVRAAIGFIRDTLTGPWLDPHHVEQRLNRPFRLRLVGRPFIPSFSTLAGRWRTSILRSSKSR